MTKEQMEQIIQQNMQKIYLFCTRRLGNTTEAEDVASDILMELLRSCHRIEKEEAVYGYLWAVAGNLCKNYWRKYKKYEHEEIPEDYTGIFMVTPEESFLHKQELALMRRELSMLTENYRRIMVAYYFQNKSCEEIAEKMQMSVTNVKQYLFEGRKKVRKGMDMQREYGVYSYAPEKFAMNFWGERATGYWELFRRKLPGSIMLAIYDKPRSIEELSMEVGVAVPYLEEEVQILEKYELLKKKGNKYYSNMVIFDNHWKQRIGEMARETLKGHLDEIKAMIEKGLPLLEKTNYSYYMDDLNARKWFLLMLIFWDGMEAAEEKTKTKISFPLLTNGSRGFVMGMRGEIPVTMEGIYGKTELNHGYLRIFNYKFLSDRYLNPLLKGYLDVLKACEERRTETEKIEALPELLENGFVRVEDGKLYPCYAEISEKDYQSLTGKLAEEIDRIADLAAKQRDMAGEELRKRTSGDIPYAEEIGSIVSMWSFLENIAPIVCEDGYMEKGHAGQNLTAFYLKK